MAADRAILGDGPEVGSFIHVGRWAATATIAVGSANSDRTIKKAPKPAPIQKKNPTSNAMMPTTHVDAFGFHPNGLGAAMFSTGTDFGSGDAPTAIPRSGGTVESRTTVPGSMLNPEYCTSTSVARGVSGRSAITAAQF
jgi:hypothetical protein